MQTKLIRENAQTIPVEKQHVVDAWSLMEKLTVSVQRIGDAYSVANRAEMTPERERQMLTEIGRFVVGHIAEDANRFRIALADYLGHSEAEALADELHYWRQKDKSK